MNVPASLRLVRKTLYWYFSGQRDFRPPPAPIKRWMLARLANKHGLRTFIETGTYQGGTIGALHKSFDTIHSIELGAQFARAAQARFAGHAHITVHHGDSAEILPRILTDLREPALFWLDAHYSEGITARGGEDTPIRAELRAILAHPVAGHVIAIDDACDFGTGDYPTLDEVRTQARQGGVRSIRLANNMLILEGTAGVADRERTLSQSGEDAIVARLLDAIGAERHQCIEFGAWDGLHGSNTAHLWRNGSWKALLIEAEQSRYEQLVANVVGTQAVAVHARVAITGERSIDALARKHGFGPGVDVLSIDIDGDDYWIFDSLTYLLPRIVICEYNPTIPLDCELVGEPGSRIGCSAASLIELARRKGYILCGATYSNLIFVPVGFTEKLAAAGIGTGSTVIIPPAHLCYVISDYDGNYSFSRSPAYGIRAAQLPSMHHTNLDLVVPHRLLARVLSAYHSTRMMLYHFRRKLH